MELYLFKEGQCNCAFQGRLAQHQLFMQQFQALTKASTAQKTCQFWTSTDAIWLQVLALLERIRRQNAGEIEPPATAIGGFRGASAGGDSDDGEDELEVKDDLEVRGRPLACQRASAMLLLCILSVM